MQHANGKNAPQELNSPAETPAAATAPRKFPKWLNLKTGGLVVVCVLGYLVFREQRAISKLAEIRAAIAVYASQVQSLEGKYSSSHVNSQAGGAAGQTAQHENDFAMDLKNSRLSLESRELVKFPDSPGVTFRFRRVEMHGAGVIYLMMYSRRTPQDDGDDWGEPHILIIEHGGSTRAGPWELAGLGTPRSGGGAGAGLVKQFADGDAYGKLRYDGMEEMNGGMCERVTIIIDNQQTTFWLDPAHDYLPRRQKLRDIVLDVFEFQQFPDEAGGGLHWFPSRGKIQKFGDSEYTISELKFNPTLDVTRFRIDPASLPDGVKVNESSKPSQTTYTGDREDLWKQRDDEHEEGMRILRGRSKK